jgi:hypothetical protein
VSQDSGLNVETRAWLLRTVNGVNESRTADHVLHRLPEIPVVSPSRITPFPPRSTSLPSMLDAGLSPSHWSSLGLGPADARAHANSLHPADTVELTDDQDHEHGHDHGHDHDHSHDIDVDHESASTAMGSIKAGQGNSGIGFAASVSSRSPHEQQVTSSRPSAADVAGGTSAMVLVSATTAATTTNGQQQQQQQGALLTTGSSLSLSPSLRQHQSASDVRRGSAHPLSLGSFTAGGAGAGGGGGSGTVSGNTSVRDDSELRRVDSDNTFELDEAALAFSSAGGHGHVRTFLCSRTAVCSTCLSAATCS